MNVKISNIETSDKNITCIENKLFKYTNVAKVRFNERTIEE